MGTREQAIWQPASYRFPDTPVNLFSLPNPTAGLEAYAAHFNEQCLSVAAEEIPARAAFLIDAVQGGLVSSTSVDRLANEGSLFSLEAGIADAVAGIGNQFVLRRNSFTKTAKARLLRMSDAKDRGLSKHQTHTLLTEVIEAEIVQPALAAELLEIPDLGAAYLTNEAIREVSRMLPSDFGIHPDPTGFQIGIGGPMVNSLDLPTDLGAQSHALRMSVLHALHAVSEGIANFNTPDTMFSLNGRYLYCYYDLWEQFKNLAISKTTSEIADALAMTDPESWEFEAYFLGVDDASEVTPDSEAFTTLVAILHELATYHSLYAINTDAYRQDFSAACREQAAQCAGHAANHPHLAGVMAVLVDAFERAAQFKEAGANLESVIEDPRIQKDEDERTDLLSVFMGCFVNLGDQFENLVAEVDETVNMEANNFGFPMVTINYEPGVLTQLAMPIIGAINEANRLVQKIISAVGDLNHAELQN